MRKLAASYLKKQPSNHTLQCINLRKETLPSDHWLIATAEGYLAEGFLLIDKSEEAIHLLKKSYKTLLKKLGKENEHTRLAQQRLKNNVFG